MSDFDSATTAKAASGITPSTAVPIFPSSSSSDKLSTERKSRLPATNSDPLPESPSSVPPIPSYLTAVPGASFPTPTASSNHCIPRSMDQLSQLEENENLKPTKTTAFHSTLSDPPAPAPGAFPLPTLIHPISHSSNSHPAAPRPGDIISLPSQTSEAQPTGTATSSSSATQPTKTMPLQTDYSSPEVTMRGQPVASSTSTAEATRYHGYPTGSAELNIAQPPGGYQQQENASKEIVYPEAGEAKRDDGVLGQLGKAVDKVNEWITGDKGSSA